MNNCPEKTAVVNASVQSQLADVLEFVIFHHAQQKRNYTGHLYISHLLGVAAIVAEYLHFYPQELHWRMLAAALLHDVVEDQGVTENELSIRFGPEVAADVMLLSDLAEGNRAVRNAASRVRLHSAPPHVQTIKCADMIHNTMSIVAHDPGFAITYLAEKRKLLDVLTEADPAIRKRAYDMCVCPACNNEQIIRRWWRVSKCRCVDVWST